MSKEYPRRRDVRELLVALDRAVAKEVTVFRHDDGLYDVTGGEFAEAVDFSRDFLTGIRDLMRQGLSFGDALVIMASPEVEAEDAEYAAYNPEDYEA